MAQGLKILAEEFFRLPPPHQLGSWNPSKGVMRARTDFTKLSPDFHICAMSHTLVHCTIVLKGRKWKMKVLGKGFLDARGRSAWD